MAARDYLMEGEAILASCAPFYATTHRILRCETRAGKEECDELPYHRIAAVELVRQPRHAIAIAGLLLALGGVFLWTIGFISSVPTIVMGVGFMLWGARGREAYYQFRSYNMPEQELGRWRVAFRGSAGFILTVGEYVRRPLNW
ncbi:MAG: hypothetical protein HY689_08090 [Chloroflexi bacterium]|nr:hypothetical protein [Chloroflexota bacterium]